MVSSVIKQTKRGPVSSNATSSNAKLRMQWSTKPHKAKETMFKEYVPSFTTFNPYMFDDAGYWTSRALRKLCASLNVDSTGKRPELVDRLLTWHHTQLDGNQDRMCCNFALLPVDENSAAQRFRIRSPVRKSVSGLREKPAPRSILKSAISNALKSAKRYPQSSAAKSRRSICFSPFNKVQLMSPRRSSVASDIHQRLNFGQEERDAIHEDYDEHEPHSPHSPHSPCHSPSHSPSRSPSHSPGLNPQVPSNYQLPRPATPTTPYSPPCAPAPYPVEQVDFQRDPKRLSFAPPPQEVGEEFGCLEASEDTNYTGLN